MSNFSSFLPAAAGGGTIKFQEFTSSGTFTPSAALLAKGGWVWLTLVGGGGGGSAYKGYGCGGGGGQVLQKMIRVTGAVTVTLGAGGSSGAPFGNKGGDSTFGSLATAYGGFPGQYGQTGSSGSGGGKNKGNVVNGSTYFNNAAYQWNYDGPKTGGVFGAGTYNTGGSGGQSGMYSGGGATYGTNSAGGGCGISGAVGGLASSNGYFGGGGASWGDGANGQSSAAANTGGGGGGNGSGGSGYCLVMWVE